MLSLKVKKELARDDRYEKGFPIYSRSLDSLWCG